MSKGQIGSLATALVLEAPIELLRRRSFIEADDIEALFLAASREVTHFPRRQVNRHIVRELIDALAIRARGRGSRDGVVYAPDRPKEPEVG